MTAILLRERPEAAGSTTTGGTHKPGRIRSDKMEGKRLRAEMEPLDLQRTAAHDRTGAVGGSPTLLAGTDHRRHGIVAVVAASGGSISKKSKGGKRVVSALVQVTGGSVGRRVVGWAIRPPLRQITRTWVPAGQRANNSAIFSLYRPIQPSEDLRPILRVSWVPWMM